MGCLGLGQMKAEIRMDFRKKKYEMGSASRNHPCDQTSARNFSLWRLQFKTTKLAPLLLFSCAHLFCSCSPPSHPIIPAEGAARAPGLKSISSKHPESDAEDPDEIPSLEGAEEDGSHFQILDAYPEGGGGPNQHTCLTTPLATGISLKSLE